jgi:hypothetical protein
MKIDEYIHLHDNKLEPFSGTLPSWFVPNFTTNEKVDCYTNKDRTLIIVLCEALSGFEIQHLEDPNPPRGSGRHCVRTKQKAATW